MFRTYLDRSMEKLLDGGYAVTNDLDSIDIYSSTAAIHGGQPRGVLRAGSSLRGRTTANRYCSASLDLLPVLPKRRPGGSKLPAIEWSRRRHPMGNGHSIKSPPKGLAILAIVGPSLVWAGEFIGSGEVILATRVGAILGPTVLWAIVVGVLLQILDRNGRRAVHRLYR